MLDSGGTLATGVCRIDELSEEQRPQLDNKSGLWLRIDEIYAFNLEVWYHSEARTNNRYPQMDRTRFALFAADIANNGVVEKPVLDNHTGEVVEGRTRLTALYRARSTNIECNFPGFRLMEFTDQTAVCDYQDRSSLQKRQLTRAQKQDLIKEAILRHPDWADSNIGTVVQADAGTIKRLSDQLEAEGLVKRPLERLGLDGRVTAVQLKDKPGKKTKEKNADERLLLRWREMYGAYPVVAADVANVMVAEKFCLPNGEEVLLINKGNINLVGRWLYNAAKVSLTAGGYTVCLRMVRQGQPVFILIRTKDKRPDLEAKFDDSIENAKSSTSEESSPGTMGKSLQADNQDTTDLRNTEVTLSGSLA